MEHEDGECFGSRVKTDEPQRYEPDNGKRKDVRYCTRNSS